MHVKDILIKKRITMMDKYRPMIRFFPWCKKETPQKKCGVSPVICAGERCDLVWFGQRTEIESHRITLDCEQLDVHFELKAQLEDVRIVLNRFMPCFVDSIPDIHQDFGFFWFDGMNRTKPLREIAGRSPSVSVLLAVVSHIIQKPLPAHVICSADVLQNGLLGTVGRLDQNTLP